MMLDVAHDLSLVPVGYEVEPTALLVDAPSPLDHRPADDGISYALASSYPSDAGPHPQVSVNISDGYDRDPHIRLPEGPIAQEVRRLEMR